LLQRRTPEAESALRDALSALVAGAARGPSLLLQAVRGDRPVGALFASLQAGRIALAWPPRWSAEEPESTGLALLREALGRLQQLGVQIVQAFPDAPSHDDQRLLVEADFEHVADLLYLACCDLPTSEPQVNLCLEPYSAANHQRLLTVLEQSYEGTLDCPRLNGIRRAEDVLASYRQSGQFNPARWFLASQPAPKQPAIAEDIGCLLLAEHPADDQWELIYVGLIPAARDRGYGRQLVRHAQWLTRLAGRTRLVLSVDAGNGPALGLYASEGFIAWDRRAIYLRIFP
jgi:ribosomal protein S18 acetylase RimI-like enzyme